VNPARRQDRTPTRETHSHADPGCREPPPGPLPCTAPAPPRETRPRAGGERPESPAWVRGSVQAGFLLFCLLLGLEFRRFVLSLEAPPDQPVAPRPAAVEAFLPISSLMSLVYLLRTGEASAVHPAGLVIFSITLASALLFRRGFCSWVCPVGTLSEHAHQAGARVLGRNLSPPLWLDRLLRLAKYALLGFFLYAILAMPTPGLSEFLQGAYNRIADVKMYLFFARMSLTALTVLSALVLLSFFVRNFWCRYLCPYGALLGLLSRLSPVGIRRQEARCTGCWRCDAACPNRVRVSGARFVRSEECTACFRCVEACPEPGALSFATRAGRCRTGQPAFAVALLLAFLFGPGIFSALGTWQSDTPPGMYRALYRMSDQIDHPRSIRLGGAGAVHGAHAATAFAGRSPLPCPGTPAGAEPVHRQTGGALP